MKILLLNPPSKKMQARDYYCSASSKADYYWQPVDLLVLSGILRRHDVKVLDATVLRYSNERAVREVARIKPDVIFFLVSTPTVKEDMRFMKAVKDRLNCRIYGSGNYFYFMAVRAMKEYPFLDGILLDFTSRHILKFLEGSKKNLKDIVYRQGKRIVVTEKSKEKGFSYPAPQHELFPIKRYRVPHAKHYPMTTMLTNFGCPFQCKFCFCGKIYFKQRDIENVLEELRYVKKLGIKDVYFRDYTFTVNRDYVKELCKRMIDERIKLGWICLSRAELADKELLNLMKKAGCHTIQFGVESGSNDILKRYTKLVDRDKIKETFRNCKEAGIDSLAHFILGLPGENKKTVVDTIKFAKELDCDFASFNLYAPLIGSESRKEVIKKGWLKNTDLAYSDVSDEHLAVETPWLSRDDLLRLKQEAIREFYIRPSYMWKTLKKTKSPKHFFETMKNAFALIKGMFRG